MSRAGCPKIAVVGGDGRAERVEWPKGYDVRLFQGASYSTGDGKRLRSAAQRGGFDHVVLVTRFASHIDDDTVKQIGVPFTRWPRGFSELAGALEELTGLAPGAATAENGAGDWVTAHNEEVEREEASVLQQGARPVTEAEVRELGQQHTEAMISARRAHRDVKSAEELLAAARKNAEEADRREAAAAKALENAVARLDG